MWSAVRKSKKSIIPEKRMMTMANESTNEGLHFWTPNLLHNCFLRRSETMLGCCLDNIWEKICAPLAKQPRTSDSKACMSARGRAQVQVGVGGGRWRRRSKTNCSDLCAFFSALLSGSAWSHGRRRATRTSRIHSELPLLVFFACICRGYECAITNDVLTLYRANRSLRGSCRSPLVAEASEKVRGAEITATAANRNTCKIRMRLHQFDSV